MAKKVIASSFVIISALFLFSAISWAAAASQPDLKVTELTAAR